LCYVSFGQRRLLCLARALLARVKILLVEEALPSVDIETEGLVRQLIHTAFKDCTVLWLTQNPLTVMHTDRSGATILFLTCDSSCHLNVKYSCKVFLICCCYSIRVLVLNNGQAVKFDAPSTVFQQGPQFSQ